MANKTFSTARIICFTLIAILLFLFCIEFSARVVLSFQKKSFVYLLYGFKNIQEKQRLQKVKGKQGEADYYKSTPSDDPENPVNSSGCRGPEIRVKEPGTVRIICLGGSTTYGDGLDFADTYPALLQKKLDEKFGNGKYEVINDGQPGLNLAQILSLIKYEVIPLRPDVVILMNINNNLKAPGFWFLDIKGRENKVNKPKQPGQLLLDTVKNILVQKSAVAHLIQQYIYDWFSRYFMNFDWKAFSVALLSRDNIWQNEFAENYGRILAILSRDNPQIKIIVIEEAVNISRFPEMEAPFKRAQEIMREKNVSYNNIDTLVVQSALLDAAKNGRAVWQSPSFDPLHLSRQGNEIVADLLVQKLREAHAAAPGR